MNKKKRTNRKNYTKIRAQLRKKIESSPTTEIVFCIVLLYINNNLIFITYRCLIYSTSKCITAI